MDYKTVYTYLGSVVCNGHDTKDKAIKHAIHILENWKTIQEVKLHIPDDLNRIQIYKLTRL